MCSLFLPVADSIAILSVSPTACFLAQLCEFVFQWTTHDLGAVDVEGPQ